MANSALRALDDDYDRLLRAISGIDFQLNAEGLPQSERYVLEGVRVLISEQIARTKEELYA